MSGIGRDGKVVEVRGLHKTFGSGEHRIEALRGVDLDLAAGEFAAIMGPSGSGKSTLLHLVGGLDHPTAGAVRVGGQDLADLDDDRLTLLRRRRIGFVFQSFNLVQVLTAEENVSLPLVIDGVPERDAAARAGAALGLVGIEGRSNHLPGELSGGEQQRVALARALVTEPLLLIADEPTGNLDSVTGDQVMRVLRTLADERGQTILMVSHDARVASIADRVLRLRDGCIVDEQTLPPGRDVHGVLEEFEEES